MNMKSSRHIVLSGSLIVACAWLSNAQTQSPSGLKFNNLTISPFVNLEYTYDSNVYYSRGRTVLESGKRDKRVGDSYLTAHPGVDLSYKGNDWGLSGTGFYSYDWYQKYHDLDESSYGENIQFYAESPRGLRFVLGQSYMRSRQQDSILDGGRGVWRDRELFEVMGALSYLLSERTSVTLNGLYSDLKYHNDNTRYGQLYGWREWSTGLEIARKLTAKSNLLLSGSFQQYESQGAKGIDSKSNGYTLQAGFGSRATERISYRALAGASCFDYAGDDRLYGFVYSLDANWIINRKWAWSIVGSSNYQPSEREANQAMQVYTLSTGVTYRPVERLSCGLDAAIRREENEYDRGRGKVDSDKWSCRLKADYKLRKYVSVYAALSYEDEFSDAREDEFSRYRGSIGLHFRY